MEAVVQRQALMDALEFLDPYSDMLVSLGTIQDRNLLVVSAYYSDLRIYLHKIVKADIKESGYIACYKNSLFKALKKTETETVSLTFKYDEGEFYANETRVIFNYYNERDYKFPQNFELISTNVLKEAFDILLDIVEETGVWFLDVLRLERDTISWTSLNSEPKKQVFYKLNLTLYSKRLNDTYIFTKKLATALCKLNEAPPTIGLGKVGSIEDGKTFIKISEDFYLSAYYEYNEQDYPSYDFSKEIRTKNIKAKLKELLSHNDVAVLIDKDVIKLKTT